MEEQTAFSFEKIVLKKDEEKTVKYQDGYLITVILVSGEAKIRSGHWMKTLREFSDKSISGDNGSDMKICNLYLKNFEGYVIISKLNN